MAQRTPGFGDWPSPISAASVAEGALRLGRVQIDQDAVYWSEGRPTEQGRVTVMRWKSDGTIAELLPPPYSARSRVHEYGGGEFLIADGRLFFSNDADQAVYEMALASEGADFGPRQLTDLPTARFADFALDTRRNRLIAVGERHDPKECSLPENALWAIPIDQHGGEPKLLASGRDFYASPRFNPRGDLIAFLAWDLPHMPWDAACLFVATIAEDGSLEKPIAVAGGDDGACFQPEWASDGTLYFVWDTGGTGSLYRWAEGDGPGRVTGLDADLSMPLWNFNAASFALLPGPKAYLTFTAKGEAGAALCDFRSGEIVPHASGASAVFSLAAGEERVALVGMRDDEALCVMVDEISSPSKPVIIRRSSALRVDEGFIASPSRIAIETDHGPVHGLLYPPTNPKVPRQAGALPPLIISLHGGPTSAAPRGLRPRTLFFTSRGFAWLDLDYSGSTGYGPAYRKRLNGNWGIADVQDTIAAAEFAGATGLADPQAIFVTGGSAGGYTVLMTIAATSLFRGAASYYGICDLVALQRTTHKFEQGYQSTLLGATLEKGEVVYRERSAIHHVDRIDTPLILFQGAEDRVVPKAQSIEIAEALRKKNVVVDYHEFAGEGHGFRAAGTIRACLEYELAFYRRLLGF